MSQSRVFVTQQPRPNKQGWVPNLTSAEKFGALHYVFSGGDRPHCDTNRALFHAHTTLHDFDPDRDYILFPNTGDPAALMSVMLVLSARGFSKLRYLNWERRLVKGERSQTQGFYTPVTFNLFPQQQ